MPSFGGVTCLFVRGTMPAAKLRVRTWIVAGLSGYGAKRLGYGDSSWKLVLEYWGLEAAAETWVRAIEALQGSLVTVVDDHGRTYLGNLVTKIEQPVKSACYRAGVLGVYATLAVSGVRQ